MSGERIVLVEDEPRLAQLVIDYLVHNGFDYRHLHDGQQLEHTLRHWQPDLLLLDVMLPGSDGFTLLRQLRVFSDIPVIMLTARVEEVDRLLGLEIGADDYLCKPFSPRELIARVRALLRRRQGELQPQPAPPQHLLQIDNERHQVQILGNTVALTRSEFRLLETLYAHPGRVFSRQQLLDQLYDDHRIVTERTVDSHIKNLRRKLAAAAPTLELISAIYGVGYQLQLPEGDFTISPSNPPVSPTNPA